ncbi:phage virion morphogenesis protein [Pseudomonas juntendi]|uniref:phage virion morphogenesis protein n=1 Tax=Pseudomonas juntendi TaxID=2666183 RepID=UPI001FFCC8E8|nr:phage virion morphogenesis protein [Pseudomonas juntendi]MCK2116527.1 phage virion morphogenesis protein [Pseudomonas juntendi]
MITSGSQPITLEVDTRGLEELVRKVRQLGPANPHVRKGLNQIGVRWIAKVKICFQRSTDPYGKPWAHITQRQGQPLLDTGRLRNSVKHNLRGTNLELASNLVYADNHQYGITVKQRRFLPDKSGLPKQWLEEYQNILLQNIENALATTSPVL